MPSRTFTPTNIAYYEVSTNNFGKKFFYFAEFFRFSVILWVIRGEFTENQPEICVMCNISNYGMNIYQPAVVLTPCNFQLIQY